MNKDQLLKFIQSSGGETTEFQLLKHIETQHTNFFHPLGETPTLYKKHFFLFNYLYQLSDVMLNSEQSLIITSISIRLVDRRSDNKEIGGSNGLRDFYLDKTNLYLSDMEVTEMLNKFWKRYLAIDEKANAIKLLGLENVAKLNFRSIKKRFNQLANKHHPDKGGDEQRFIELEKAYSQLKRLYT